MKICKQCGLEFDYPYKQRYTREFCSKSCASRYAGFHRSDEWKQADKESMIGEKNPMWNKEQTNPNSLGNLTGGWGVPSSKDTTSVSVLKQISKNIETRLGV